MSKFSNVISLSEKPPGLTKKAVEDKQLNTTQWASDPLVSSQLVNNQLVNNQPVSNQPVGNRPVRQPVDLSPTGPTLEGLDSRGKSPVGVQPVGHSFMNERLKLKPIIQMQDGLTLAATTLYKVMYGGAYEDAQDLKECQLSYKELAAQAHLHPDTVRTLLPTLEDKGVIKKVRAHDSRLVRAAVYQVRSMRETLRFWRQIGATHVTIGKSPVLCDEYGKLVKASTQWVLGPSVSHPVASKPNGRQTQRPSGSETQKPVGLEPTLLDKREKQTRETSSEADALRDILTAEFPLDRRAAQQLVTECRKYDSICTLEEIAAEVRRQWRKASRNPVGLVLVSVPEMFPLPRAGKSVEAEQWATKFDPADYKTILEDPAASEAEKKLARQQLETNFT